MNVSDQAVVLDVEDIRCPPESIPVLYAILQVIPSVKGLDLKALKSMLKKESCYTTILTTARIRGTETISIIDETSGSSNSRV